MQHAAHRTMSKRKAAGSRRNKKQRFVGIQYNDTVYVDSDPIGHGKPANHLTRTLTRNSLEQMFALPTTVRVH